MTQKRDYNRLRPKAYVAPTLEQQIAYLMNEILRVESQVAELTERINAILDSRPVDSFIADDLFEECQQDELKRSRLALQVTSCAKSLVDCLKEQKKALN